MFLRRYVFSQLKVDFDSFTLLFCFTGDDADDETVSLRSLLFPIAGSVITILLLIVIVTAFIVTHRKKRSLRTPKDTENKILKQKLNQEKQRAMNTSLVYSTTNRPVFASITQQEDNEVAQEIRENYKYISDNPNRSILCCPNEKTTYAYQPTTSLKRTQDVMCAGKLRDKKEHSSNVASNDGEIEKNQTCLYSSPTARHCFTAARTGNTFLDDLEGDDDDFESDSLLSFSQKENALLDNYKDSDNDEDDDDESGHDNIYFHRNIELKHSHENRVVYSHQNDRSPEYSHKNNRRNAGQKHFKNNSKDFLKKNDNRDFDRTDMNNITNAEDNLKKPTASSWGEERIRSSAHRKMRVLSWIDDTSDNSHDSDFNIHNHRRCGKNEDEKERYLNQLSANDSTIRRENKGIKGQLLNRNHINDNEFTTNADETLFDDEFIAGDGLYDDVDSILTSISRMDTRRMNRLKNTEFYKRLSSKKAADKKGHNNEHFENRNYPSDKENQRQNIYQQDRSTNWKNDKDKLVKNFRLTKVSKTMNKDVKGTLDNNIYKTSEMDKNRDPKISNKDKINTKKRLDLSMDSINTNGVDVRYLHSPTHIFDEDPNNMDSPLERNMLSKRAKIARRSLSHEEILSISSREDNGDDNDIEYCRDSDVSVGSDDYEKELAEWESLSLSSKIKKAYDSDEDVKGAQKTYTDVYQSREKKKTIYDSERSQLQNNAPRHRDDNIKNERSLQRPVQYVDTADGSESFFKIVRPAMLNPDECSESGHTFSEDFKRSRRHDRAEGSGFEESNLTSPSSVVTYSYDRESRFIIVKDDKDSVNRANIVDKEYERSRTVFAENLNDVVESFSSKEAESYLTNTNTSRETLNDEDYEELAANLSYDDESLSLTFTSNTAISENEAMNSMIPRQAEATITGSGSKRNSRTFENILRELKMDHREFESNLMPKQQQQPSRSNIGDKTNSDFLPSRSYFDKKTSNDLLTSVKRYTKPQQQLVGHHSVNKSLTKKPSTSISTLNDNVCVDTNTRNEICKRYIVSETRPKARSESIISYSSSLSSESTSIFRSQSSSTIAASEKSRVVSRTPTPPTSKFGRSQRSGNLSAYISSRQSVSKSSANATSTATCQRLMNRSMSSPKLSSNTHAATFLVHKKSPARKMFHMSCLLYTSPSPRDS